MFNLIANLVSAIRSKRESEALAIKRARAYRELARAAYLIACAQRCVALPNCRAAYLANARAAIAHARALAA